MNRQHSILIIDNSDRLPVRLHDKLTAKGYKVNRLHTVEEGLDFLIHSAEPPTFILADRQLDNGLIEVTGELEELCRVAAGSSEVLVYTNESDLSSEDKFEILNQGAYRVLNKQDKLVENINTLIQHFDEFVEVTDELQAINTDERNKFITALIGADVTLTFFDQNYRQPRNTTFARLLVECAPERPSSGFCQNQCWLAARNKPAMPPKCWGCTVAQVFKTKEPVEALFFNRQPSGSCNWVTVESKPIRSEESETIIAVRELFAEARKSAVDNLTSETRLNYIAESLIRIGFGRARIYAVNSGGAELRAAAAYTDAPANGARKYFDSVRSKKLPLFACQYAKEASENSIGSFVDEWKQGLGESPLVKELGLELPYFDVPVYSDNREKCGWISVDFVGLPEELREQARKDYEKIDTLTWLSEEYGSEVRIALETIERDQSSHEKSEIVRRARFGIAEANSMNDAIKALLDAFRALLPDCRMAVRILRDNELREHRQLAQNPWDGGRPNISMDTVHSLSVAVAKRMLPNWINDYPDLFKEAKQKGDPGWLQPPGTESTAQIPLIAEGIVFGTLSISSPRRIKWTDERYDQPILELAQLITLMIRDVIWRQEFDKAMNDRAAILAFSMNVAAAGLWRHWAQQRLSEISARVALIRSKLRKKSLEPEELEQFLLAISSTIVKIGASSPLEETTQTTDIESVFSRLIETYKDRLPSPTFSTAENYTIEVPPAILKNVLTILLDNASWSINSSGIGRKVSVEAYERDDHVIIDVCDDGPGISAAMQERIFRDRVESLKRGQGLGLLYARGAALQYGGGLEFTSRPRDTRFSLSLPLNNKRGKV